MYLKILHALSAVALIRFKIVHLLVNHFIRLRSGIIISQSCSSIPLYIVSIDRLLRCAIFGIAIKPHLFSNPSSHGCPSTGPDWFVSHTWSSRFYEKVGVLILRFTSGLPFVIALLLTLVCRYYLLLSPGVSVLLNWVFLLTGLLLEVCISSNGRTVFFDRFCIHQNNPVLLEQGINYIDDAICSCKRLGIMWSKDYFKRLWCVYEVGLFLDTHPLENVEIWPQFIITYIMFWGSINSLYWSLQLLFPTLLWCIPYFVVATVFTAIEDYPNRKAFVEDFSSASSSMMTFECSRKSDVIVITDKVSSKHGSIEQLCSSLQSTFGVYHVSRRLLLVGFFIIAYPSISAIILGAKTWDIIIEMSVRVVVHIICHGFITPKRLTSCCSLLCRYLFIMFEPLSPIISSFISSIVRGFLSLILL